MKPLVSICIPAYNNADYIKETIDAILKQTYENIEVIVVDDQSKDDTVKIVEAIEDKRVHLHKNEQNLGMVGNWNRCITLASGEYVKLVCADDILYPESIEKEVAPLIANETVNLVVSDTALIDIDGNRKGAYKRFAGKGIANGKKCAKTALMINNFFGAPCNTMFKKKAFLELGGFDEKFTYILDFDMWVRLACLGDIYVIHEKLNGFRMRDDSNTGNMINRNRDVYVAEHRRLVETHAKAGILKISKLEVEISVFLRKVRNIGIGIYLKLFSK